MMTRRRGSIMAPLAVLMVLMVVLLATPTNAVIHEDEVGQRDWMMRLVGDVRQAVVPTMRNPSQIIVSSAEGAVASLDISPAGAVNLTWREIFSEHPHCIAASSNGVAVIGESGTLSILNLLTGFVEVAYRLAPSSHGLSACTMQGEEVSVVLVDGTQAKVFRMDINSNEETVAPTTTIDLGSAKLSSLHLAGAETLLVGQDAGVRRYSTSTGELQATHEGRCTSSTPTGSFVIATAAKSVLYQVAADSTVNEGTEVCSRCATIAVDEVNPAPHAVYFVSTPGAEKITIHFPSDVQVAISRPPVEDIGIMPLIAMRSSGRVFTLIKTMENHLMLINDDDARPLVWERYEGLAHPAAAIIAMPVKGHIDHFHFNQELIAISDKGIIYVVPLAGMGQQVQVLHSIGSMLASILGASSMAEVKINSLTITPDNTPLLTVSASARGSTALMQINRASGVAQFLTKEKDMLLLSPNLQVSSELVVKGKLGGREELFLYTAKVGQTELRGYSIRADAPKATPMWSINAPYPIVALASADEDHARFANHLRVYRNVTGKEVEEEVHRRYPTENTLAVAYYEPSEDALHTLVVMAVDTITGNVLATTRHASVEGPIHMVVVENNILFHFLDAAKMRYCIGVWEMFESEGGHTMRKDAGATIPQIIASFFGGAPRVFSSRATRPPRVAAMTLGLFGGPIADMAATTSEQAIARKSIVLAFESGRVAVVDLNRLLAGGQMRMAQEPDAPQLTHVVIPSVGLASHRQRLALPQRIITASTRLESSSHVVVAGLDLFYIRSSSGKPFDVLNTDFNKQLLISLVGGFAGLSVVVRYLVVRKSLSNQWK